MLQSYVAFQTVFSLCFERTDHTRKWRFFIALKLHMSIEHSFGLVDPITALAVKKHIISTMIVMCYKSVNDYIWNKCYKSASKFELFSLVNSIYRFTAGQYRMSILRFTIVTENCKLKECCNSIPYSFWSDTSNKHIRPIEQA